jgi:hypothetical protein
MKILVLTLFSLGFLGGLQSTPNPTNAGKPLTVCEVLRDLSQYQASIIEVRGRWSSNKLEGQCPVALQSGSHKWPNAISLTFPQRLLPDATPANWRVLDPAVYRFALLGATHELDRDAPTAKRKEIEATITGRLDVRFDPSNPRTLLLDQFGAPFGYGNENAFPAQLVMINIRDVALVADGRPVF